MAARRAAAVLGALALAAGCGGDDDSAGDGAGADVSGQACEDTSLRPDEDNLERIRTATLCLVNAERTERDVDALERNEALADAARRKAVHMVENRYFAHQGPDGRNVRDWVSGTGYLQGARAVALGENLGWASERGATPARVVEGWMRSRGHRDNILRERFEDSGIGVALGAPREEGGGGATYVQVFGRR